jgi:transposase, IS6 family
MKPENDFKWRKFEGEIILWAVRWYCKYVISYRNLQEMIAERGIDVYPSTLYRWVQAYAAEIDRRARPYFKNTRASWRVDETLVKVKYKWKYLYRAI